MRILMIAPTPFFADRGCHTQIYEEIRALQKIGHEIILCTYGLGRDVPGVTIVRTINFPWYTKLSAGPSRTKMLLLPFLAVTVMRQIVRFRPDVVHGHLHEGALIALVCRALFPRLKYLFDMQGSLTGEVLQHGFMKRGSLPFRVLTWLERMIAHRFFVITQSDSMVRGLLSLGVEPARIANVHDGVDTDAFSPRPFDDELAGRFAVDRSAPRVLYMGLLEEYQGVDLMIGAFALVARTVPGAQFLIIGYPNIDKYKNRCASLGILERTVFFGKVDYLELPRYLSLAEIAVAPKISATEGDGKIYNYMAMGMVTVAWDRSVAREILGDTGILAELKNPRSMADRILWCVNNSAERKARGIAARKRAVAELSWNAVGRRIDAVYAGL